MVDEKEVNSAAEVQPSQCEVCGKEILILCWSSPIEKYTCLDCMAKTE